MLRSIFVFKPFLIEKLILYYLIQLLFLVIFALFHAKKLSTLSPIILGATAFHSFFCLKMTSLIAHFLSINFHFKATYIRSIFYLAVWLLFFHITTIFVILIGIFILFSYFYFCFILIAHLFNNFLFFYFNNLIFVFLF